jgi:hypothetical protein
MENSNRHRIIIVKHGKVWRVEEIISIEAPGSFEVGSLQNAALFGKGFLPHMGIFLTA